MSYGELWRLVGQAAGALAGLGIGRGEVVALLLPDSPLAAAAFLGALRLGALPLPLNTRLAPADYAYILRDCRARLLVAEDARGIEHEHRMDAATFESLVHRASPLHASVPAEDGDPAFWLYSSGTTGRPKGILHSHRNCAQAGKFLREVIGADADTVVFCTSKMFFAYGLDNALLGPLSIGARTLQFSSWPDAEHLVEAVARHRPGCLLTMPTMFRRMLQLGRERLQPLRAVRYFYTGGERLPDSLAQQWHEAVGVELLVSYGMSETFCNATANFRGLSRGAGSIGLPLDGVACKVLDAEGRPLARGEPGLLWLRHPSLALRYSDPEATARAFRDGWISTGDICTIDEEGFIYHQGRSDELLRVAGQWVKPAEVVETVLADPRVRDAVCVVVPDTDGFERLALFVVPAVPGEAARAAQERCQDALPRFSQPKWIREVEEFPKTATGKVQRYKLREALLGESRPGH